MINVIPERHINRLPPMVIRQRGLTLVELMISMSLALFVLAGVLQIYATSSQNSQVNSGVLRIQENIRYVISRLEEDISQGGNAGCFSFMYDEAESANNFSGADKNTSKNRILNILANRMGEYDWRRAISGINGASNASDSLTLRYVSPLGRMPITGVNKYKQYFMVDTDSPVQATAFSQLKPFDIVVAASCEAAMIFMVTNNPAQDGYIAFEPTVVAKDGQKNEITNVDDNFLEKIVGGSGAPVGAVYTTPSGSYTYSIGRAASAKANCSHDNPQYCALLLNNRELVEGVQDLQVEFGRQFGSGDHLNLQFVQADAESLKNDPLGWGAIDRIRMTITFNSINNVPTNEGSQLITKSITKVFAVANQRMKTQSL